MAFNQLNNDRPRILVVGGGYVGFTVASKLQKEIKASGGVVTVVDPHPYMTYLPFLPEVAGGNIEPRHATVPLRQHLRDCEVIGASVEKIDHERRIATVRGVDAGDVYELSYDQIVLGAGSVTRAFPIPGLAESAIGMKTIEEAQRVRNWVLGRIDYAALARDESERRRALTFVVVGGGFAGIETIAEIEDMARTAVERTSLLRPSDLRFILVEAMPRIMPEVPEQRAESVVAHLRSRGIEVLLNTSLGEVEDGTTLKLVNMADKSSAGVVESDTLIWTAGVQAAPFLKNSDLPLDERGRLRVGADLRVTGDEGPIEGAWGAGDNAAVPDLTGGGVGGFCVPNAQHASRQAVHLAKNLLASRNGGNLEDYYHENLGAVAGLGAFKGVANIKGRSFEGPLAWMLHRLYHGYAIPTTERTVRVVANWMLSNVFGRDTTPIRHEREPRLAFQQAIGVASEPEKARL